MERRNKFLIIVCLVFSMFLLSSCNKENVSLIKKEFESLNNKYFEVNLDNDNVFIISNEEEFNELISEKKSFVVLYGNYEDNYTRSIISLVNEVSKYEGLSKVYFIKRENDVPLLSGYIDGLLSGNSDCISSLFNNETKKLSDEMIKESKDKITNVIEPVSTSINSCDVGGGC